jgi:hypothetical protein
MNLMFIEWCQKENNLEKVGKENIEEKLLLKGESTPE